ncbi:MAG: ABC transporter ATP-binding protein [bacterium]
MVDDSVIQLDRASKSFTLGRSALSAGRRIQVVDKVSLSIRRGEILCLVGESGCGKTTTGKLIAGLLKPTSGTVLFEGKDIWRMEKEEFSRYRRAVQIVHQDPYASLNPIHTVYKTLSAPLFRHGIAHRREEAMEEITGLLTTVDLTPPEDFIFKYPHQLSGGQRQRIVVARALTVNPQFIVADEAVSMVDVSIRLSILGLLSKLKEELGMTFLFITHDLALAKYFAWEGRIAVMYLGQIVEMGPTRGVIDEPFHPYTRALLAAIPEADPEITRKKKMMELRSLDIPSLLDLPPGCKFHPRCPFFIKGICDAEEPELFPIGDGRQAACYLAERR